MRYNKFNAMNFIKKLLKVFLILGVLIIGFIAAMQLTHPDIPPPDDLHLRVSVPDIPDNENAYSMFMNAVENLDDESRKELFEFCHRDPDEIPIETVEHLTNKYADRIEMIERASELTESFAPTREVKINNLDELERMPDLVKFEDYSFMCITGIMLFDAFLDYKREDVEKALEKTFRLLHIGQKMESSGGGIVRYMTGNAIKQKALNQLYILVSGSEIKTDEMMEWISKLSEFKESDEGYEQALKQDYQHAIEMYEKITSLVKREILSFESVLLRFGFERPNRARKTWVDHYSLLLSKVGEDFKDVKLVESFKLDRWIGIKYYLGMGDPASHITVAVIIPSDEMVIFRRSYTNFKVEGMRTYLALRAYKNISGELPLSLDKLVPDFLPEIPFDPFDGEHIRFDSEKGVVYSVGKDLKDDGGEPGVFVFDDKNLGKIMDKKDYVISIH